MALEDLPSEDPSLLEQLFGLMSNMNNSLGALVLLSPTARDVLKSSMDALTFSFQQFSQKFSNEIIKSNDSLVAVNSSLAQITENYAQSIVDSQLPFKTAIDALTQFELAGLKEVGPSVLQLAGIMDLTNQNQKAFVKLMTDAQVFGGIQSEDSEELAQTMMRASDEFGVSFDKLVMALDPVVTSMAQLSLVTEENILGNADLVVGLSQVVGQDGVGLLRNVIEKLSSFTQISPNEFSFPALQELRDALQEQRITEQEFIEQLPGVVQEIEKLVGPILQAREGSQVFERSEATKLFDIQLLAQMSALVKQFEIANTRSDDPINQGFVTLRQFQESILDSFYIELASLDQNELRNLAENLGRVLGLALEIGMALAGPVAQVLEVIRDLITEMGGIGPALSAAVGIIKPTISGIEESIYEFAPDARTGVIEFFDRLGVSMAETEEAPFLTGLQGLFANMSDPLTNMVEEIGRDITADRLGDAKEMADAMMERAGISITPTGDTRTDLIESLRAILEGSTEINRINRIQVESYVERLESAQASAAGAMSESFERRLELLEGSMDRQTAAYERFLAAGGVA